MRIASLHEVVEGWLVWLRYNKLKLDLFLVYNFGRGDRGCTQFLSFRFVPKSGFRSEAEVSRHFESYYVWSLGGYYVVIDTRSYQARAYSGPARPSAEFNPDDLTPLE